MQAQDIIIKPIISEKSLKDASVGKYTFLVNKKANKTEIKKAIEGIFEVKVTNILTNITKGSKTRNTRAGRHVSEFSDKKARVTLSKGQSIAIFDEHLGIDKQSSQSKDSKKEEKKEKSQAKKETKKEDNKE